MMCVVCGLQSQMMCVVCGLQNMCSGSDLHQDSLGGAGGCGCASVEEGELTRGTAAVEGGGGSKE